MVFILDIAKAGNGWEEQGADFRSGDPTGCPCRDRPFNQWCV